MSEEYRLAGGKAIAAIAVVVAIAAFQFIARSSSLESQAATQIGNYLAAEYARTHLPVIQQATQSPTAMTDGANSFVKAMLPESIEVHNISARGKGDEIRVRAEVTVNGSDPPDGRCVRYFRMRHSSVSGWTVEGPSSAITYYLSFS